MWTFCTLVLLTVYKKFTALCDIAKWSLLLYKHDFYTVLNCVFYNYFICVYLVILFSCLSSQWRNTVVRTSVYGRWTFPALRHDVQLTGDLLRVNRPMYVSQHGQLSHSSSWVDKWVVSWTEAFAAMRICVVAPPGECLLVKADMVLFAGNTEWSISERVRGVRQDTLY